jgi:hypothetical protein
MCAVMSMDAVMSAGHGFAASPFALGHGRLARLADADAAVTRLRRAGLHAW